MNGIYCQYRCTLAICQFSLRHFSRDFLSPLEILHLHLCKQYYFFINLFISQLFLFIAGQSFLWEKSISIKISRLHKQNWKMCPWPCLIVDMVAIINWLIHWLNFDWSNINHNPGMKKFICFETIENNGMHIALLGISSNVTSEHCFSRI